jgi:hypothetical protein
LPCYGFTHPEAVPPPSPLFRAPRLPPGGVGYRVSCVGVCMPPEGARLGAGRAGGRGVVFSQFLSILFKTPPPAQGGELARFFPKPCAGRVRKGGGGVTPPGMHVVPSTKKLI